MTAKAAKTAVAPAPTQPLRLYDTVDALETIRMWVMEHDDEIRAAEGALPDELAELLAKAELDFNTKVENVGLFIRELELSAAAMKNEAARLTARQRHMEKAAEGLRRYLLNEMGRAGIPKVEGKRLDVRMQKNPPSIKYADEGGLIRLYNNPDVDAKDMVVEKVVTTSYRLIPDLVLSFWKAENASALKTLADHGITVEQGAHLRFS